MIKRLLHPFCRHRSVLPVAHFLDNAKDGKLRQRWVWKCNKCGKEFLTKGAGE